MIEHKLKLKFDDSFNGVLFSTQGDTGRVFEVEVRDELDNAIDIAGHKLEFYVGNESKVTKVEASVSGNKFIVKPVNEQFTKSGLNKAQFVLYDKQGLQVGSQIFDLHVEESIQQGATVGSNVVVDFSKINEALELIKGYEKTFEESKGLDATLNASIEEGRKVDQDLKLDTSAARGVDANLKTSTTKASETYTKLEVSRTSADILNTDLKANIAQGNKTNANLQASIGTANNTQTSLQDKTSQGIELNTKLGQSIKTGQGIVSSIATSDRGLTNTIASANTSKTNLDASVSKANTAKTNLDASIDKANTTKTKLDESTSQGNATDIKLKDTDTKAGTSISTLQDLLNQSATTEKNLKEIIASGNLDKYVTTPKLEEALAKIKTLKKEVVQSLPQAGQDDVIYLVKDSKGKDNNYYLEYLWLDKWELIGSTQVDLSGYVTLNKFNSNNQDLYKSLSGLETVVNIKVDKIEGKGLSTNDFTDEEKTLVAKIPGIEEAAEQGVRVGEEGARTADKAIQQAGAAYDAAMDAIDKTREVDNKIDVIYDKVNNTKADKAEIVDFKRCIVLTTAEYNALNINEKIRVDTLYFIKD